MALALVLATHAWAAVQRHALVIANNASDREGTPPLRFADDDGYRWRETFERLGIDTTLLTVPDADTARLESNRGVKVLPPSVAAVAASLKVVAERIRAQHAAGDTVDVLLVYVGHGQVGTDGRAYLTLTDGQLDQKSLYAMVDGLGADYVHLIVDACHAGGVVGSRGADPAVLDELRAALTNEQLKARPNVGALFAQSEEGETHEWSRIRAGVFSHAARSGLLGAADVNRDGEIAYSELDAFIASAIRGVKGARGRLKLKTSPPALDANRVLVGPAPNGPTLKVPADAAFSRMAIDDDDGIRLADVNRQQGERVAIALPVRDTYWLRTQSGDARVSADQLPGGAFELAQAEVGQRGSAEEGYVRGLFATPFGRDFYEGYQANVDAPDLRFAAETDGIFSATAPGRFDGAWLNVGLSIGVPVSRAPLGAAGVAAGVSATWRSDGWLYGAGRAQWTFASGTLGGASIHRAALAAMVGARTTGRVALFAELGPQWGPTFVVRTTGTQGDLLAPGAIFAVGAMGSRTFLRGLRLNGFVSVDAVVIDKARRAVVTPGGELSIAF